MTYTVTIYYPGKRGYEGGFRCFSVRFKNERKARDYYTDMLLRYPDFNVEFIESEI